jgi:ABC-type transport system involved in multi-copper enzyme maturation permease subunit
MVARLWWKDLRQFWPIWGLIALLALAVQPILVRFFPDLVRSGELAGLALGWTCLYAYAVAAAAFAGERENRTLAWLDAIPVDRKRVWAAKASFALASTLALGLVLLAAAAVSTERWTSVRPVEGVLTGLAVVLVVLGCGLLWSTVASNALLAAVLSIGTSLVAMPLLESWLRLNAPIGIEILSMLAIVAISWLASWAVFVATAPPSGTRIFRGTRRLPDMAGSRAHADAAAAIPRPSFWGPAAHGLLWQSWREARSLLGWMLLLAVVVPGAAQILVARHMDFTFWIGGVLLAFLVAGVAVFGNDLRHGSNRLLAHHGVRPAVIWLVRVGVWFAVACAVVVIALGAGLLATAVLGGGPLFNSRAMDQAPWVLALVALSFCIPLLCGMVIRRGITAGVVAILLWFAFWIPLVMLSLMGMMPSAFPILVPLAVLGVSLAWSGDWLIERPGAGRWLRLLGWCAGISAALFAVYVSMRVYEIPRIDPAREAALLGPVKLSAGLETDNAAPIYTQAAKAISHPPDLLSQLDWGGLRPLDPRLLDWLHKNEHALALLRQAATRPACQFADLDKVTVFSGWETAPPLHVIPGMLLELSIRDQLARGDLDGAWKDIDVLFRLARHRMSNAPVWNVTSGLYDERRALRLAMAWAADGKQTAARLRAAKAALASLPALDVTGPIRDEARILRNTEELPRADLLDKTRQMLAEPKQKLETAEEMRVELMTTPWELARTSRAWRMVLGWMLEQAKREPWAAARNAGTDHATSPMVQSIMKSTPLLAWILPPIESYLVQWDRNEVGRRALVQILALRAWQLDHGGKLPDNLGELVETGELDRLPDDPFAANHPFGYVAASGQSLLPLDDAGILWGEVNQSKRLQPVPSGRLLYSIGPDCHDDHAGRNSDIQTGGDIIFPLIAPPR